MRRLGLSSKHRCRPTMWAAGVIVLSLGVTAAGWSEPPSDSEAQKHPPPPAPEQPAPPREPTPAEHDCPWLEDIIDDLPLPSLSENREEYYAYNHFVLHARRFTPEQLAEHARLELTWHLLQGRERHKYRGEIARVEGRLKRLLWIGSNKALESEGVKDLYEAWIFPSRQYFGNPMCVIISELPPGLEPSRDSQDSLNVHVSVDAYFFKRYRYRAQDGGRLAPLLIGRTLTIKPPSVEPLDPGTSAFNRLFLPVMLSAVFGMIVTAFLLHRWFRSSDKRVQKQLERTRPTEFIAPIDPDSPPSRRSYLDDPSWN